MYPAVPRIMLSVVSDFPATAAARRRSGSGSRSLASPKSRILTRPSFVTKTFSGLMSRWTIPLSCAAASPVATAIAYSTALRCHDRAMSQNVAQRPAMQDFADDVGSILIRADVMDRQDVGVIQGRRGSRFLIEATQPRSVGRVGWRKNLDGDVPPEPLVPRRIDLAHPALAEQVEDSVRADGVAGYQGHREGRP